MPSLVRIGARHDDLVAFAGTDLVVTARAPVVLHCVVGLYVANIDGVRVVPRPGVWGPGVFGHRRSDSAGEEAPGDEQRDHRERTGHQEDVAPTLHLLSERIEAHASTVPRWRPGWRL